LFSADNIFSHNAHAKQVSVFKGRGTPKKKSI
jgi:hypothetical protein